jgi:signal transduction histidine kinase
VNHRSIAFRLIAAVLLVELVSAVLVTFLSFGYERHTHFFAFEVMLHGRADSVLGAVEDADDKDDNVMLNQADVHVPPDDVYQVYEAGGRLLGRSANWQGLPPGEARDGISRMRINGRHYRMLQTHGTRIVDPGEPGGGKVWQVTILYGAPTEHVWKDIGGAVEFYAAGSALLVLVTGPLIAWLLHRGLLPLRQLAALAALVSVDSWEFTPPASARTTPELAPLTQAIENVLQRLERSFRQQRTFVSDAAHELKTGVAVVKSSLQLTAMKRRSTEEYQAGLERCLADCRRLEEVVAGMLTLARAESDGPRRGAAPAADLAECLRGAAAQLETVATVRGVHVAVAAPTEGSCPIGLDAAEGVLLVSNLLLNAIQHSRFGTQVEVRLSGEGQKLKLEIEDHGDGIDAAALPHVFDRFYRGDPSRTRNTGGTGLGLAICKAIVDRAGGSIELASQLGAGTTATVRLPLAEGSAAPRAGASTPSA